MHYFKNRQINFMVAKNYKQIKCSLKNCKECEKK